MASAAVCALVVAGCVDEQPVAPADTPDGADALSGLAPEVERVNVGAECETGSGACIPGELRTLSFSARSSVGWVMEHEVVSQGTEAGSRFQVDFCIRRSFQSEGDWQYCGNPAVWQITYPSAAMDPPVARILGRWPESGASRARFEFVGRTPTPSVRVERFERPEPEADGCSVRFGFAHCAGPVRAVIAMHHVAWWPGRFSVYTETPEFGRLSVDETIRYLGGPGTSEPARYSIEVDDFRMHDSVKESAVLLVRYDPDHGDVIELRLPLWGEPPPLTLEADPQVVDSAGRTVTMTADAEGALLLETLEWRWSPAQAVADARTRACAAQPDRPVCRTPVYESGTMTVRARVDGLVREASADIALPIVCGEDEVRIRATGPHPGGSFTSRSGEDRIELVAELDGGCADGTVRWSVVDAPDDRVASRVPSTVPDGAVSGWRVTAPGDPARWPGHRGRLEEKALAYHVTALVDVGGTRVEVGPVRVAQDEIDTARQEYIEYLRRIVPGRDAFGAATGVRAIFGDGALEGRFNTGDYDVHLATRDLAAGVDALGAEFVRHRDGADGLVVVSGYRNPVHQNDHVGATAVESRHLYGRAVDLRVDASGVDADEEGWHMIAHAARNSSDAACVAPERIWNRDGTAAPEHLHVDLRSSCPRGW